MSEISREQVKSAALVIAMVGCLSACNGESGSGSTPTAPTPAAPTSAAPVTTRIIGVSGNLVFGDVQVGASRSATLTISNSGNATLTVNGLGASGGIVSQSTVTWTSGQIAPGASQQVTITFRPTAAGVYAGTLTVDADHTSGSNTLPISGTAIDAPYSGTWVGNYVVERCDGAGSVQDVLCSAPSGSRPGGVFPVGTSLPIAVSLKQTGDTVSGTFALGEIRGAATGVVSNGLLTLQGTATSGLVTAVITHWSTRAQGNVMEGSASYNVSVQGVPGMGGLVTRLGRVAK